MALRVEPFIKTCSFPDGIKVQPDGIAGRNNGTGNNVVAIHQAAGNRFADSVDVDWGSSDEGNDKADCCGKQSWNHDNTKPTHVEAVVGGCDPLAKGLPSGVRRLSLKYRSCHLP